MWTGSELTVRLNMSRGPGSERGPAVWYSFLLREMLQFNYPCQPPLCMMKVKSRGLINRCDLPGKKLRTVIELPGVDSVVSPARWGLDTDCDNSLIWRRCVNISKRPITLGGDRRNISLFEVVIFAESIPRSSKQCEPCSRVRTYTRC